MPCGVWAPSRAEVGGASIAAGLATAAGAAVAGAPEPWFPLIVQRRADGEPWECSLWSLGGHVLPFNTESIWTGAHVSCRKDRPRERPWPWPCLGAVCHPGGFAQAGRPTSPALSSPLPWSKRWLVSAVCRFSAPSLTLVAHPWEIVKAKQRR